MSHVWNSIQFVMTHPQYFLLGALVGMALLFFVGRIPWAYNVRNLTLRWRTTATTALAFTLVIGLLTVMVAFVNGMNRLCETSGNSNNLLLMASGVTDEAFSNLPVSEVGDIDNQPGIAEHNGQRLCSRETYLVASQMRANPQPGGPKRRFLQIRGIEDPIIAAHVHDVELLGNGQWFSEAGVEAADSNDGSANSAIQVVLGEGVARELGRDRSPEQLATARNRNRLEVGDSFQIGERRWNVVGVMKMSGSSFDSEVWAKRDHVAKYFGKMTISTIAVRAESEKEAKRLKDYFANEYKKATLQPLLETEYFASLSRTNLQFAVAVSIVAFVMGLGGVFGIMNTMFAAISQRIKDIGVLRIVGYARWQILVSFLLESLLVALLGGVLGCALGFLANGWSATSILSSGAGAGKTVVLRLVVDSLVLSRCLLLALLMGFIGGVIPALNAMRLRPLEALR